MGDQPRPEACGLCRWYEPVNLDEPKRGYCRMDPPQLSATTGKTAVWPVVQGPKDWCGQFVKRPPRASQVD